MKRILLVPDNTQWVIGAISAKIEEYLCAFQFRTASAGVAQLYPSVFKEAIDRSEVVHFLTPYEYARWAGSINKPTVVTLHHCTPENTSIVPALSSADYVHVIAGEWRDFLVSRGIARDKIFVMPNGVDAELFNIPTAHQRRAARAELGIPDGRFVIGFFGKESDDLRKGSDIFIASLRSGVLDARKYAVVLAGVPTKRLVNQLAELPVSVRNLGFVESCVDLVNAYHALDCYAISARCEGGPCTLLEAMSCAVPVISTPVGIARDILTEARDVGIRISKDSPRELAEALESLRKNPEACRAIGRNARELVTQRFAWRNVLGALDDNYRSLLKEACSNSAVTGSDETFWERVDYLTALCDKERWEAKLRPAAVLAERRRVYREMFCLRPFHWRSWYVLLKVEKDNKILNQLYRLLRWLAALLVR